MFANFQLVIYITSIMLMLFWASSSSAIKYRAWVLIVGSLFLIATLSFESLLVALFCATQAMLMVWLQRRFKLLDHIGFSCLIFIPLLIYSSLQEFSGFSIQFLGLSFFTLKLYSFIRDNLRVDGLPSKTSILFYVFFFPVFSAGPIENFKSLNPSILNNSFDANEFLYGLYRILLGVFKIGFVANEILNPVLKSYDLALVSSLQSWVWTILSFLFLYLNFSGFSDIAIGFSRLFSIKIRENFNSPLRATTIQEFWQRWHMSLGAWVTQYLYFPLVRAKGKPLLSLFVVFVFMGAWHSLSLNYLIWGISHGLAMVAMSYVPKRLALKYDNYVRFRENKLYRIAGGFLTISYVAVLSKFANFSSLEEGMIYLHSLI